MIAQGFDDADPNDLQDLYRLYKEHCRNNHEEPTLKDFHIWAVEKGYIED